MKYSHQHATWGCRGCITAVCAGIFRLSASMGNQFNRLRGYGCSNFNDSNGRPPWNFYSDPVMKKMTPSTSLRNFCISRKADFVFLWEFFPLMGDSWILQGLIRNLRGTFELKTHPTSPQFFFAKMWLRGSSWICCAAQLPHCKSDSVDRPLKMLQINAAEQQWYMKVKFRRRGWLAVVHVKGVGKVT